MEELPGRIVPPPWFRMGWSRIDFMILLRGGVPLLKGLRKRIFFAGNSAAQAGTKVELCLG
jgi:hypothetical protein